jgi:hypothetical protein
MNNTDRQLLGELLTEERVQKAWPEFWAQVDFAMLLTMDDMEGDPRDLGEKIQALWMNELREIEEES